MGEARGRLGAEGEVGEEREEMGIGWGRWGSLVEVGGRQDKDDWGGKGRGEERRQIGGGERIWGKEGKGEG